VSFDPDSPPKAVASPFKGWSELSANLNRKDESKAALLDKERKPDTWPLRSSGVMNQIPGPFNLATLSGQIQPLDWP
jgi:hypothetical protein